MSKELEARIGECPTCGQNMPIEDKVRFDENTSMAVVNGIAFSLTETHYSILEYLVSKQPGTAFKENIYDYVYGMKAEGDQPNPKIIDVLICKLRDQVTGSGLEIETVRGKGYRVRVHSITDQEREEFIRRFREEKEDIEERNELIKPHLRDIESVAALKSRRSMNVGEFCDDLGPLPEIEWIRLDDIIIDHNYQRELNTSHVRRIALQFKWAYFQPPSLSSIEGGKYVALDGQHRIEAAKAHPLIEKIPAYVTELPETAEQAEAFVMTNKNRLGVNPVNIYWASITAGKKEYVEMKELLDSLNLEIVPYLGYSGANKIAAVTTLFSTQKRHGPEALARGLETLRDAYPKEGEAFKASLIGGIAKLYASFDNVDKSLMIQILNPHSPKELGVQAYYVREELGGSSANAFFEAVRRMYNEHLKTVPSLRGDVSKFLPLQVKAGKTGKGYYKNS